MNIRIEGGKLIEPTDHLGKKKRSYYTFWVHVFAGAKAITISGWKYFPDGGTVSSPSVMKGQNKFVNTTRLSREFFNEVLAQAQAYFGGEPLTAAQETEEVEA